MLETNQNKAERILRLLISMVLLPAPFVVGATPYAYVLAGVGGVLLFNAASGTCMTYKAFGVNTCEIPRSETE